MGCEKGEEGGDDEERGGQGVTVDGLGENGKKRAHAERVRK